MMIQYLVFIFLVIAIKVFCWVYTTTFCEVYESTRIGWIHGWIFSILIDWFGLSLILPFFKACIRSISINFKSVRFLIFLECFFNIKNLIRQ